MVDFKRVEFHLHNLFETQHLVAHVKNSLSPSYEN